MRVVVLGILACLAVVAVAWLSLGFRREPSAGAAGAAGGPAQSIGADPQVAARLDELTRSVDELRQQVAALQRPREGVSTETPTATPSSAPDFVEQHRAEIERIVDDVTFERKFRSRDVPFVQADAQNIATRYGIEREALAQLLVDIQRRAAEISRTYAPFDVGPGPGTPERAAHDAAFQQLRDDRHAALSTRYGDAMAAKIEYYLSNRKFVEDAQR